MPKYVALVQQGIIENQDAIADGTSEAQLWKRVEAEAKKRNHAQTGFGEGWTGVVLEVK